MSTGNWPTYNPTSSPTGNTSGGGNWIPGALGGIGSAWINARQQRKEREHRTAAEEAARKYNLEQWHRQNLYNHPLEQMARLKQAGLNPNLIYGSSPGSAVGNAGAVAPGKAPELNYRDFFSPGLQSFQNVRLNQAQTNNLQADVMLKGTQSLKTANEAGLRGRELDKLNATFDELIGTTKLDFAIKGIQYDVAKGLAPHQIANMQSTAEKNRLGALLLNKDLEYAQAGFPKGNTIGTVMKGVFNLDMTNPTDRKTAQAIVVAVLGSQVIGSFTSSFKNLMQAFTKTQKR